MLDTHTSVASCVYQKYLNKSGDNTKTLIAATASPYKFAGSVMKAIADVKDKDEWEIIELLRSASKTDIPRAILELREAPVLHKGECDIELMENMVKKLLGVRD